MSKDLVFLHHCFELVQASAEQGLDPFAAILVKEDQILAQTADKSIRYCDPTAHAELILISEYCREKELISLEGYTLYCNVEPCVMCSGAIHWARISRVVFGVSQQGLQGMSKGKKKPRSADMINIGNTSVDVIGPLMEEEGLAMMKAYPFFSKKDRLRKWRAK